MQVEILLAAMVLAVAVLVAVDLLRRTSDAAHEQADRPAHDAEREMYPASRTGPAAFPHPAVRGGRSPDTAPAETYGPVADGRQHRDAGTATSRPGLHGARKNWHVSTRLALLAAISAAAAALVTAGTVRAVTAFQGASFHSDVSSVHDGAVVSAIVACIFAVIVLVLGLWCAIILIRSVLRPLHTLQAGAVELAEVRLPDALRRISQAGQRRPVDIKAVGVSSPDEIGEVARAFDQMQREVLRLAVNEAGLHERLGEMFVELAHRSHSLVERQTRLIADLEQGERDTRRLASLLKMDHITTRMRRQVQNLLVLAGHELPGRWNQPVTLADVIRAAISEIEDYERVSFSAQPGIAVAGPAVNDVVHLIAELADNATSLSAADTPVDISGRALASGGVLIEVTDQGVGMSPDQMAQANWQLDHPSAADVTAWRSMSFMVVGRLAALHGARVRLQQAESGGLAALVWLPDAIVMTADTAPSPGPGGIDGFRSRPGAHEATAPDWPAMTGPGCGPAEREAGEATALSPAPVIEDFDLAAGQRRIPAQVPGTGPSPRPARPGARARLLTRPRPPARDLPARDLPARDLPARDQAGATSGAQANPPEGGPAPSPEPPQHEHRLPVYEAVESDWFRNRGKTLGGAGATEGEGGWASPADAGWHAAGAVAAPSSGGLTTAGLPVRVPRANLVPGAISGPQPAPPVSARSAAAVRDRLAGFQRGVSQGRAATGSALDSRGQDKNS
jgi:signal transduction histidine kinase